MGVLLCACSKTPTGTSGPTGADASVAQGPKGNGDSFSGTQYLEDTANALTPALLHAAQDVDSGVVPAASLCTCDVGGIACSNLSALSADAVSSCASFGKRIAHALVKVLQNPPPVHFVTDAPLAPIDDKGTLGPVTAATKPGQPVEIQISAIEAFGAEIPYVLGGVLGHEFTHHAPDPGGDSYNDGSGYPADNLSLPPGFPAARGGHDRLSAWGDFLLTWAVKRKYYIPPSTGAQALSCTVLPHASSVSINVDQAGAALAASSVTDLVVAGNRPLELVSANADNGDFNFQSVARPDPSELGMHGTLSVAGNITLTFRVKEQGGTDIASCSTTLKAAAVGVPTHSMYLMYQSATGDVMYSFAPTEGTTVGYQSQGPAFQLYDTPTKLCSVALYRAMTPQGTHVMTTDAGYEGNTPQGKVGYCCASALPHHVGLYRAANLSNWKYLEVNTGGLSVIGAPWVVQMQQCYIP